jgi:two-component system, response regulator / RNA-binding antiterminator
LSPIWPGSSLSGCIFHANLVNDFNHDYKVVAMSINTVLVSESVQSARLVQQVLQGTDYQLVFEGSRLSDLITTSELRDPALIIMTIARPNQQLISQLKLISKQYPLPVVIFTDADGSDAIKDVINAGVSAYIVDGLSKQRLLPILSTALARFEQNQSMQKELTQLRTSLADRKTIDRAKGIIMEQRQCSEEQAYALLRTSAMNQNIKIAALAKTVIKAAAIVSPVIKMKH